MYELRLRSPAGLVERLTDLLVDELGALATAVEDADAGDAGEQALFGEPSQPLTPRAWPHCAVQALFDSEAAATEAATLLLAQPWAGPLRIAGLQLVPDEDWVRLSQAQFQPVDLDDGWWIVPTWHQPPPQAARVIRLDPGLAFGTGTHPTTRMCLRWLVRHAAAWPRVLDYGCGSGILAIGAAMLGAREVDAVDLDPAAIAATRANAVLNGVQLRAGAPDLACGHYDVVVANILAAPLKLLAPILAARASPAGTLVLAGLLERQVDEMRAAYAPWCDLAVADRCEGWALMVGEDIQA